MAEHRYAWRGNDRQGQRLRGEMQANSPSDVAEWLRQQRIRPTQIQRQWTFPAWLKHTRRPRIQADELTQMTRQLATLLHAGVPLLQSFDMLGKGLAPSDLQTLIRDVHTQIEGGIALNQAFRKHQVFDAFYCNLVAAGEMSGTLDVVLDRLAHHLEKTQALQATVRSALVYPAAILVIAFTVLALILVFVVPAFQNIFASFGAELPWLTRMVIALSETFQRYGMACAAFAIAAAWWARHQIRHRVTWQARLDRFLLRIPITGELIRHACTARWTRTLATLFTAGVPLTEALDVVQGVTGNAVFQAATQSIQAQLMRGTSLSKALDSTEALFPPMVGQMCAIGEESGALDHMLAKTADYYEREVDSTVARLSTLMEPFIMVVLGVLIGGLVMALYLPIFQLGQVV
jgi:type IV pilus assembly protein PilC